MIYEYSGHDDFTRQSIEFRVCVGLYEAMSPQELCKSMLLYGVRVIHPSDSAAAYQRFLELNCPTDRDLS
jgi:hypothetical protein